MPETTPNIERERLARFVQESDPTFWSMVDVGKADDCWEWQRYRMPKGYGMLTRGGQRLLAHRHAYALAKGAISDGYFVLHRCDNPPCCNPAHLYLGDHAQNMLDMVERRRARGGGPPGERNGRAKLTAEMVRDIRDLRREIPQNVLAGMYGIGTSALNRLLRGASWTDLGDLTSFVVESCRIEGIEPPLPIEVIAAHESFLSLDHITVSSLETFVAEVAAAPLRRREGMDVRVGNHRPPRGGPSIADHLDDILVAAHGGRVSPYEVHVRYETLHPFMDGNGRSGRALWAWQMLQDGRDPFSLPFLHRFYYQALDGGRDA